MNDREEKIKRICAPYSAGGAKFLSRNFAEEAHPHRSDFQRDRDRVVHSKSFRRLEYKTQVFVNHLGDNYRTRLTHSIEVAQIARTIARALDVNEDLTETIALAHDLGHPPFGHAGEHALHEKMKDHGGFDHNEQTLRIVVQLEERYPQFSGLNLTYGTLCGLQKHNHLPDGQSHSIEAQIVDIADEIAYNNHDLDDGIESGYLSLDQIRDVSIWNTEYSNVVRAYPNAASKIQVRYTIRGMVNAMVNNLISETAQKISDFNIKNFDDVLSFQVKHPNIQLCGYQNAFGAEIISLKNFLFKNLYRHPDVVRMNERATRILHRIFDFINSAPEMLPQDFFNRISAEGKHRVIADFISGMTDRYAIKWNNDILGIQ